MAKAKKMLSAVLAALMVVLSVASYVPAQAAKAVNVPKLQMVTQPEKEYKNGDRVSLTVTSPNYGGQVEYRVILWNGTTKKQSELWPTHKGYYYQNWKPAGSYKFTIHWPVEGMEPGAYSLTVLTRRANSKVAYDSFVKTEAFWVKNNAATIAPIADITVNEGEKVTLPENVTLNMGDNTTKEAKVTWDAVDTAKPGEYTVNGTVEGIETKATVKVIVKSVDLKVESVSAINFAELKVVFNTAIDEDTLDLANIKVDGLTLDKNINNNYSLSADGKELIVYNYDKFATQQQQKRKISISGIKSVGGKEMTAIVNQDVTFADTELPRLVSVTAVGNKKLVLTFSEAIDYALASTTYNSNYRVDNKIVTGVGAPEIEWRKITIVLASPLAAGEHTASFVNGAVRDFALYLAVPEAVKFTVAEDTAKPTVELVSAYQEKIVLKFSKEIDTKVTKVYWMDGYTKKSASLAKPYADTTKVLATFGTSNALPLIPTDVIIENAKDYFGNVMDKTTLKVTATADIERPTVVSIDPDPDNKEGAMIITFSEKVDVASARVWGNIVIKNKNGTALNIPTGSINYVKDSYGYDVKSKIRVTGSFISANAPYTVTIKNIADLSVYANKLIEQVFTVSTPDVTIPNILSVGINSANRQISIAFNETMDANTLANLANYSYSYGDNNDQYASMPAGTFVDISSNGRVVTLTLPQAWVLAGLNTTFAHFTSAARNIMIKDIADASGNAIPVAVRSLGNASYSEIAATVTEAYILDANTLRLYLDNNVLPMEVYAGDFIVKTTGVAAQDLTVTNATLNSTKRFITLTIAEDLTADAKYEVESNKFENIAVSSVAQDKIALTKTAMGTPIKSFANVGLGDWFSPSLNLTTTGAYAGMLEVTNNTVIIPFDEPMAAIATGSDAAKSFRVKDYNGYLLTEGVDYRITANAGDKFVTLTLLSAGYNNILTIQLKDNLYVKDNSADHNAANDFEPVVTSLPVVVPAQVAAPTISFGTATVAGNVKLVGTTTAMEYKIGDGTWATCTGADMEVAANINDKIYVRIAATASTVNPSSSATLTVAVANIKTATAPAVTLTKPGTGNTGKTILTGSLTTMEYKIGDATYADCTADMTIDVTVGQKISIRVKATAQQPASEVTELTVAAENIGD